MLAEERVGLLAPGNRTATLHLDDERAAVLVDLRDYPEQPPPPVRVLRAADRAVRLVEAGPTPVAHALDVYRTQLLAERALERIPEQRDDKAHPGSLVG